MKSWSAINKMMVIAALGMLLFGTLDVAFGLRRNLDAFVFMYAKGVQPADEFAEISDWVNVMKFADYAVQTFIGDGILVSPFVSSPIPRQLAFLSVSGNFCLTFRLTILLVVVFRDLIGLPRAVLCDWIVL